MGSVCVRCCGWVVSHTLRDGEPQEDAKRKMMLTPLVLICAAYFTVVLVMYLPINTIMDAYYPFLTAGYWVLVLRLFVFRALTACELELIMMMTCISLVFSDAVHQSSLGNPSWPAVIIVLDCLLVTKSSEFSKRFCVCVVLIWTAIERLEHGTRFGLYEAAWLGNEMPVPKACNCETPPCAKGAEPVFGWMSNTLVFLLDYYLTRGFAHGMQNQQRALEESIAAAEDVGELLARYDTDAAQTLLVSATGEALPPRLQRALRQLVSNLQEFKPFLPQSVLLAARAAGDVDVNQLASSTPTMEAPSGIAAVAFTDIVGSTKLWEASPEDMEQALDLHNLIIRQQVHRTGGYEVKTIGDSFMVSFVDPVRAVLFGVGLQEAMADAAWPEVAAFEEANPYWQRRVEDPAAPPPADGRWTWNGIALRIGIAYGQLKDEINPITNRTDYRGHTVNLASRCESVAPHGGVIISEDCFSAVREDVRLEAVNFDAVQARDLKGIGMCNTYLATPLRLIDRMPFFLEFDQLKNKGLLGSYGSWRPVPKKSSSLKSSKSARSTPKNDAKSAGRSASLTSSIMTLESASLSHLHREQSRGAASVARQSAQLAVCPSPSNLRQRKSGVAVAVAKTTRAGQEFATSVSTVAAVVRMDGAASQDIDAEPGHVREVLNQGLLRCVAAVARTQGKLWAVVGDTAHCTWNVFAPCAAHQEEALRFASLLLLDVRAAAAGVASGAVMHGHVGTARQRFAAVAGLALHLAEALAPHAGALAAGCLACYLPETPAALRGKLRPVDAWRVEAPAGRAARSRGLVAVVEQPLFEQFRTRAPAVCPGVCTPGETPPREHGEAEWRAYFHAALEQGSTDALSELFGIAKDSDDAVLAASVRLLAAHQQRHPGGAPHRAAAPFVAAAPVGGTQSSRIGPRMSSVIPIPGQHLSNAVQLEDLSPVTPGGSSFDPPFPSASTPAPAAGCKASGVRLPAGLALEVTVGGPVVDRQRSGMLDEAGQTVLGGLSRLPSSSRPGGALGRTGSPLNQVPPPNKPSFPGVAKREHAAAHGHGRSPVTQTAQDVTLLQHRQVSMPPTLPSMQSVDSEILES